MACEAKVVGAGTWVAASSLEQQGVDGRAAERCRAYMSRCMVGGKVTTCEALVAGAGTWVAEAACSRRDTDAREAARRGAGQHLTCIKTGMHTTGQ
jgi:hypothetical protein